MHAPLQPHPRARRQGDDPRPRPGRVCAAVQATPIAKVTAEDGGGENPTVVVPELPQPRPGWSFLEVMLTKGTRMVKKPLASMKLAISVSPAEDPLVYEAEGLWTSLPRHIPPRAVRVHRRARRRAGLRRDPPEPPEAEFGELVETSAGVTVPAVQGDSGERPRRRTANRVARASGARSLGKPDARARRVADRAARATGRRDRRGHRAGLPAAGLKRLAARFAVGARALRHRASRKHLLPA